MIKQMEAGSCGFGNIYWRNPQPYTLDPYNSATHFLEPW